MAKLLQLTKMLRKEARLLIFKCEFEKKTYDKVLGNSINVI